MLARRAAVRCGLQSLLDLHDAVQIGLFWGTGQSARMLRQHARPAGFAASADLTDADDDDQLPVVIGQEPEQPAALSEVGAAIAVAIAGSFDLALSASTIASPSISSESEWGVLKNVVIRPVRHSQGAAQQRLRRPAYHARLAAGLRARQPGHPPGYRRARPDGRPARRPPADLGAPRLRGPGRRLRPHDRLALRQAAVSAPRDWPGCPAAPPRQPRSATVHGVDVRRLARDER